MGLAQAIQFPVALQPMQAWNGQFAGEAQVTFLNLDPSHTIYIGNVPNFSQSANSIPITPSSTITVDGKKPWWISGPVGTANCAVIPGSIQYSPGTPVVTSLLNGQIQLPFTITSGGFMQTPILPSANFESFNCIIRVHTPNVTTVGAPFTASIQLNWYADAAGTIPLFIDEIEFWSGGLSSGQDCYIRGPIGGPFLQATVAGANSTSNIIVDQFLLYGSPNVITTVECRQSSTGSGINGAGFLLRPVGDAVFENIAAEIDTTLVINTNYILAMPLMPGEIWCQFITSQALANSFALAQARNLVNGAVTANLPPGTFWSPTNNTTPQDTTLIAPRSPMYAVIATSGVAPTITFTAYGNGRSV